MFGCSDDSSDANAPDPCPSQPTLQTNPVTQIENGDGTDDMVSVTLNGEIINNPIGANCETLSITSQGFVWATNTLPTIEDESVSVSGTNINASISNLNNENVYYVRTYLTNTLGTFYGNEVSFETPESPNPVYLADNGITIKAREWAEIGMSGEINGFTYTIVDRELLDQMISDNEDLSRVCITKITDLGWNGDPTNSPLFFQDMSQTNNVINQELSNWDVSNVTNMSYMFYYGSGVEQDFSNWDFSNVTNMMGMFNQSSIIPDSSINNWDVSNVTNMSYMFEGLFSGNLELSNWDVSNVTDMSGMFAGNGTQGADYPNIGVWNVSNVANMYGMFFGNTLFNQDISTWNVSNVNNMQSMFAYTYEFNQDLSDWDVANVTNCGGFYINPLNSWTLPQPNFTNCNPD